MARFHVRFSLPPYLRECMDSLFERWSVEDRSFRLLDRLFHLQNIVRSNPIFPARKPSHPNIFDQPLERIPVKEIITDIDLITSCRD